MKEVHQADKINSKGKEILNKRGWGAFLSLHHYMYSLMKKYFYENDWLKL